MSRKQVLQAIQAPDPNPALQTACANLTNRADHFSALSNKLALLILVQPNAPELDYRKRLAHDHIIRAEIFREAANLVARLLKREKS